MKRTIRLLLILTLAFGLFIPFSIQAEETMGGEVQVSISYSDENLYNLSVIVNEGGSVIDGEQSIREGIVQYDLPLNTSKKFQIIPDQDYRLKRVCYKKLDSQEESDVTNKVVNGIFTVQIESTHMVLEVEFERKEGGDSSQEDTNTKDYTQKKLLVMGMLSALLVIVFMGRKRKQQKS